MNVTFFCPSSKHFGKSNPVVGSMLAGVISHQPAQGWMISLTGLCNCMGYHQPVVSADNWFVSTVKCATSH